MENVVREITLLLLIPKGEKIINSQEVKHLFKLIRILLTSLQTLNWI